jgi:hypothetical protein
MKRTLTKTHFMPNQRHDWGAEKRAALDAWAWHILALATRAIDSSNVVPLPASRAAG